MGGAGGAGGGSVRGRGKRSADPPRADLRKKDGAAAGWTGELFAKNVSESRAGGRALLGSLRIVPTMGKTGREYDKPSK